MQVNGAEVVVVERRTMRTDADYVLAAPPDVEPMLDYERRFQPRLVHLSYTNWHDGEGWRLQATVAGPWILKDGSLGRRESRVFIDLNAKQPEWLRTLIADNTPPDQFDVSKKAAA